MLIDILIAFLLLGAVVAMVLFIWFNTNAFVEYLSFIGVGNLLHIRDYTEATKDDPATTYPEYLIANHNNFFTRMISCPKCVCVQLAWLLNFPIFFILQITVSPLIWGLLPFTTLITAYVALWLYYQLVNMIR
jgi:hypothetical protein